MTIAEVLASLYADCTYTPAEPDQMNQMTPLSSYQQLL